MMAYEKPRESMEVHVIPAPLGPQVNWKVRIVVARFPFYIDSDRSYATKEQAEAEAEKWKARPLEVHIKDNWKR